MLGELWVDFALEVEEKLKAIDISDIFLVKYDTKHIGMNVSWDVKVCEILWFDFVWSLSAAFDKDECTIYDEFIPYIRGRG